MISAIKALCAPVLCYGGLLISAMAPVWCSQGPILSHVPPYGGRDGLSTGLVPQDKQFGSRWSHIKRMDPGWETCVLCQHLPYANCLHALPETRRGIPKWPSC